MREVTVLWSGVESDNVHTYMDHVLDRFVEQFTANPLPVRHATMEAEGLDVFRLWKEGNQLKAWVETLDNDRGRMVDTLFVQNGVVIRTVTVASSPVVGSTESAPKLMRLHVVPAVEDAFSHVAEPLIGFMRTVGFPVMRRPFAVCSVCYEIEDRPFKYRYVRVVQERKPLVIGSGYKKQMNVPMCHRCFSKLEEMDRKQNVRMSGRYASYQITLDCGVTVNQREYQSNFSGLSSVCTGIKGQSIQPPKENV